MKCFNFIATIIAINSSFFNVVTAQTNINLEQVNKKTKPVTLPRFIDDIEIKLTANKSVINTITETTPIITTPIIITSNNNIASLFIEKCSALQFKYAILMNRTVETITNNKLFSFIDEWWGTPYKYGGTDKVGIDCSAFSGKLLATIYNVSIPRTAIEQYQLCEKIAVEDLLEGDLVFFNTNGSISHVGVYLGNHQFVHSSVQAGVTISSMLDGYYNKKFIGCGRLLH
jgi:hypothetical protein